MEKITISDLSISLLDCLSSINSICSLMMDESIESSLNITSNKKEKVYFEFSKFKNKIDDYNFLLEMFNKNRDYNLQNENLARSLELVASTKTYVKTALRNVRRILRETVYEEFEIQLRLSVRAAVSSANSLLEIIRQFLKQNLSESQYNNVVNNFELENLEF